MAELVEGTQELAVQDGQGSAGSFVCCSLCLTPSSASQVSSANLILPIDHVVSPKVKLVVFVNEVIQRFLVLARDISQGNSTLTDSHEYKVEACQEHGVSARWSKEKVSSTRVGEEQHDPGLPWRGRHSDSQCRGRLTLCPLCHRQVC